MSQHPMSAKRYLVLFSKGPNWHEGVLFKEQPEADRHNEYMTVLRNSGQLIRGVPLADASGSVALFLAQDLEEAHHLLEGDPMVKASVMKAELYEWKGEVAAPEL